LDNAEMTFNQKYPVLIDKKKQIP